MKQAFKEHCNRSALIRIIERQEQQIADLKQHICQSADFKLAIHKANKSKG